MDEKGVMMGYIGKVKVIVSKYDKKIYMTQPGNREWASLIECISQDGRRTRPWAILKGKQHQDAWFKALPGVHIAMSANGWTDNEIGLEWIKQCFEPETRCDDDSEYRLLILDGHASHVTTKVIWFCVDHKIILLCLPPHTTHLLQPLDVGIFAALATAYKAGVRERSKYIVSYNIDKLEFLEILSGARDKAITPLNIEKAWAGVGLEPYDPEIVMKRAPKRPSRPVTPPSAVTLTGPNWGSSSGAYHTSKYSSG
jgi:DDE superfamily endonuclease